MTVTVRQAFYRLAVDGRTPEPCTMEEWAAWRSGVGTTQAQRVDETRLPNGWHILTIFTGLDQRAGGRVVRDQPCIFVTTAWNSGEAERPRTFASTWDEAQRQHDAAVALRR